MTHQDDPFAAALQTAHAWVRTVAQSIGTDDRVFAYRVLRSWLHAVRDRIGVSSSAHLAAQLPEVLRGMYYEGWVPGRVPVPHDVGAFVAQFAAEAGIEPDDVPEIAGAVTRALNDLFSPGQLNKVSAVMPIPLFRVLSGDLDSAEVQRSAPTAFSKGNGRADADRLAHLEDRVQVLGAAVALLARGAERLPIDEIEDDRMASAAQQAHRLLLAEGLVGADGAES